MPSTTTMTVRLSGALSEFVAANVSETGSYENISEYIRDLNALLDAHGRDANLVYEVSMRRHGRVI